MREEITNNEKESAYQRGYDTGSGFECRANAEAILFEYEKAVRLEGLSPHYTCFASFVRGFKEGQEEQREQDEKREARVNPDLVAYTEKIRLFKSRDHESYSIEIVGEDHSNLTESQVFELLNTLTSNVGKVKHCLYRKARTPPMPHTVESVVVELDED